MSVIGKWCKIIVEFRHVEKFLHDGLDLGRIPVAEVQLDRGWARRGDGVARWKNLDGELVRHLAINERKAEGRVRDP